MAFSDEDRERLKVVVNRALSIMLQNRELAMNWGFYLFDRALDGEAELRNKISAIYLGGMLDTMEPRIADRLRTARFTAQFHGLQNLRTWCERVAEFRSIVATFLARFSYEEVVFVQFLRDGLVHGWLAGEHEDRFRVRWFNPTSGNTEQRWLDRLDRLRILAPFFDLGLDVAMAPLRDRVIDKSHEYWHAIGVLQTPGYLENALVAVYRDIGITYDASPWKPGHGPR
jgi:hypothetical protein